MRATGGLGRRGRFARAVITTVAVVTVGLATVAPGASAGSGAPAVDDVALTARDLLATVPFAVRPTCTVGDPTDTEEFAGYGAAASELVATLTCSPEDLSIVYYDQFADADAMEAAFETNFAATQGPSGFGSCPSRTEYDSGGKRAGVVACRIDSADDGGTQGSTATLAFTYAPTATIVWATDSDPDAVWSFFEDDAGPLTKPDFDEIAPVPTSAGLLAAAKKLGKHLPKQARRSCIPVTDFTSENLQSFFPYRLVIVADMEECQFDGGIEAEYLQLASTASADYIMTLSDFTGPEVAKFETFTCPGQGTYKGGQWGCKITQPSTGEELATVVWTTDKLATYSYGLAPATDARRLLEWFVDEAGPNT